jgi:hypothetical protein
MLCIRIPPWLYISGFLVLLVIAHITGIIYWAFWFYWYLISFGIVAFLTVITLIELILTIRAKRDDSDWQPIEFDMPIPFYQRIKNLRNRRKLEWARKNYSLQWEILGKDPDNKALVTECMKQIQKFEKIINDLDN